MLRFSGMRAPRGLTVACVAAALATSIPRGAGAQTNEQGDVRAASKSFADGERAFRAGDFTHAAEAFEAAYAAAPHADALWNAARAWHRAGEAVRAANLYAQYLREAPPNAPDRNSATNALVSLSAKLGRLEIHREGVDDVRVDGRPVDGASVYVYPGRHLVSGRRAGERVEQTESVAAGAVVSIVFAPAPTPPAAPPTIAPPPASPPPPPAAAPARASGWSPTIVWIGGGITALAAAATVWSGLDTLAQRDAFFESPSQDKLDAGRAKQTRTNVLLGASVGLGVLTAATALFLVDWRGRPKDVEVAIGPQAVSVSARFR